MTPNVSSRSPRKGGHGKGRMVLFSLVAIFAMLLSACGGGNASNPGSKTTTLNVLASPNGNFKASNFNPFIDPSNGAMYGAQGMIYETLIYMNRYDGGVTNMLASDHKLADDASSVTFTIRNGVKWNDGQAFSADDVTFTLNLLKQYPALDQQGLWTAVIKDVTNPDSNTVKVDFKSPNSTALWNFSQLYIVPKHTWSSVSDPATYTNDKPVGTGPYTLKSFGPQAYTLQKNSSYWQSGLPKIDQLRYLATSDNTAAQLKISKGEIDWAGVGWDPKYDASFTQVDPQHYHHWFPGNNTVMLYLNLTRAPFNDLKVRQAISLAINRDDIHAKAALYADPANPTAVLPSHKAFLSSDYQNAKFSPDAARAESLLKEAGYTKGSDGIYQKNGKKISFQMIVPSGWADWEATLAVISDNLKAIGIDAKPNSLATPDVYTAALNKGDYDAAISWTDKGPSPYFTFVDLLRSDKTWSNGKAIAGGSTNWEHWQDSATDKLLNQYLASADPNAQKQAIQGIEKIMVDQLPVIPLDYNVGWFEYTTKNAVGWPDQNNPYAYGSPFDAPDNENIVLHLSPANS
ncbi:peptide ABC transporter substrate-binding protein [Ktedonobacter sp. SOSP1-85]|uniref:ABC transporter substrate-binding protein n=1 Tax=Ktedonobacter sp. SOSP1-85 TaxID=2778367 RepID=UPI001915C594|nr:ABC transporter substrate-binding protein [Ktedonobacter sp. SOSP1-85]GHO81475.1 peptide ABC transporter substrate-binding protein [Ktedonobacter sp. SOSP1-85]